MREVSAFAKRIEAVARKFQPDVLHAHSPVLDAMAAQRVADKLGCRCLRDPRLLGRRRSGQWHRAEGSWKYRATRWLETRAVRKADAVAVICEGLKRDLVRAAGSMPARS
jgi:glycogen(starch) synthase